MSPRIDFDAINAAALAAYPGLLLEWFPAGRIISGELCVGDWDGNPGQSLKINIKSGVAKDWASGEKAESDPIATYARRFGVPMGEAARCIASKLGIGREYAPARQHAERAAATATAVATKPKRGEAEPEREQRQAKHLSQCVGVKGTPAQTYMMNRGLRGAPNAKWRPFKQSAASNAAGAMVVLATDDDGRVLAYQQTYLTADGEKTAVKDVVKRTFSVMHGWHERAACRIAPAKSQAGGPICTMEGYEDAVTVRQATELECWPMYGVPNIAEAPFPKGRPIIVVRDNDAPGSDADKAIIKSIARLIERGYTVLCARPPMGIKDANQLLQEHGEQAVSAMIDAAHPVEDLRGAAAEPVNAEPDRAPAVGMPDVEGETVILDRSEPLPAAREFVRLHHVAGDLRTLHRHRGEFFRFAGSAYRRADEAEIRADLYAFLDRARILKDGHTEPYKPNRQRVADVLDALRATVLLPATITPPAWLDAVPELNRPPAEYLPVANGLLHVPSRDLYPATPSFFGTTSLPVPYQDGAGEPREWLDFLAALWPDDPESVGTLQEIFGLLLTSDTRFQKIFLIVGPKRSGKGTLGRVIASILGQENVTAPTLSSLSTNFGLAPLIGKPLAIIADARLGGRADQAQIAERLLSISGEDSHTIDRKHMDAWHGRLPTRFLILSNELPRLADSSGALASRFIVLTLEKSFYGREDLGLGDRLLADLPGIFGWALDGLDRLRASGFFRQPAAALEAIAELENLGSPIGAFIRDRCNVGPELQCEVSHLYRAWQEWGSENGRRDAGTVATFGRDLRSAVPGLKIIQPRTLTGRTRAYAGINLA